LLKQSNVFTDIICNNNNNNILCGDFNINIFMKKEGVRYIDWSEKTKFLRDNFISTNKSQIATNFSQLEQTDFILLSKKSNIKSIFSTIVKTDISDHYAILTDFI
jgi:endonuclease/exonuclease/phosphatase family metal-dependent hydrolase